MTAPQEFTSSSSNKKHTRLHISLLAGSVPNPKSLPIQVQIRNIPDYTCMVSINCSCYVFLYQWPNRSCPNQSWNPTWPLRKFFCTSDQLTSFFVLVFWYNFFFSLTRTTPRVPKKNHLLLMIKLLAEIKRWERKKKRRKKQGMRLWANLIERSETSTVGNGSKFYDWTTGSGRRRQSVAGVREKKRLLERRRVRL
jgi:hypothetical protein